MSTERISVIHRIRAMVGGILLLFLLILFRAEEPNVNFMMDMIFSLNKSEIPVSHMLYYNETFEFLLIDSTTNTEYTFVGGSLEKG